MPKALSDFHYPPDIELKSSPLNEAWLEIRWRLEPIGPPQLVAADFPLLRDTAFAFALGKFYESVKDRFGFEEALAASQAPGSFLPYVVQYRFREAEDTWPILQLGPGVATVNFTTPYTWTQFKETARYLRSRLMSAYGDTGLDVQRMVLRYRNAIPCKYSSNDLLVFLKDTLNTTILLPAQIPGHVGQPTFPTSANIRLTFEITEPKGHGSLRVATGSKKERDPDTEEEIEAEHIIMDFSVASEESNVPKFSAVEDFDDWLTAAHAVIHEWFFSVIEGPLRRQYEGKEG